MVNVITPFSSQKWDIGSKEVSKIRRSLTARAKATLLVALMLVTLIVVVVVVCFYLPSNEVEGVFWPSYISESEMGQFNMAAVSTDAAACAPIGRDIFERNGTAIDAAIAVLLCMGVHTPQSMGLGGGFLMLYYNRNEQRSYYLDAREVAPRKATEDMFNGKATLSATGGLSIAVPGEIAGYVIAHHQFGRLPWEQLFTPSIRMCREGFRVSSHLSNAIAKTKEQILKFEALKNVFLKNDSENSIYKAGDIIKRPDMARTLEVLSKEKMKGIYGPSTMANQFLEDMKEAGSIIDTIDMQSYSPRMREPVSVRLRNNHTLHTTSMPGSGPLLAFMLSVLEGYPAMKNASRSKQSAALAYHRMVETFKFAYAHRNLLEDEETEDVLELVRNLTSKEYPDDIRNKINDTTTFDSPEYYGAKFHFMTDHGTSHLSLVAPNGDAVSVTSTINSYFGSKVLSPSTGIILNNEMDDFSSPDITNYFDLPPSPKNRIRPGKRPFSSMSPMILVDPQGDVKLVLGGNGGTTITTGVLQVAARILLFDEDLKQSIDAPRIHHQLTPNIMHYEQNFPKALRKELEKFGHKPVTWSAGMMSIVMGVMRQENGSLCANSDYRKGGDVDGF